MNKARYILLFFLIAFSSSVLAEIYQWRDANGKLHFSDSPPPEAKAEKKELDTINVGDSVEIDHAAKRREEYEKKQEKKAQQQTATNQKDLVEKCKKLESEYIDLKWGKSQWADHTVLQRDGKTISRREQNEFAEKLREEANRNGCNIKFKKW